jgi:DNA-binding transcriptional MerR regulator
MISRRSKISRTIPAILRTVMLPLYDPSWALDLAPIDRFSSAAQVFSVRRRGLSTKINELTPAAWEPLDLEADFKVYARTMALKVSDLAGRVGLTAATVRYYERLGLLPTPERSPSGYRQYDEDDLADRLRFIKGAQRFGLRLDEIRELLDIQDQGQCPCGHTQELLRTRVAEVDEEMRRLAGLRTDLVTMIERADCDDSASMSWPCAVEFIGRCEP